MNSTDKLRWRKSSRCGNTTCVEVAAIEHSALVRDSKLDNSPILTFDRGPWSEFLDGVKAGEFDR